MSRKQNFFPVKLKEKYHAYSYTLTCASIGTNVRSVLTDQYIPSWGP